VNRVRRQFSTDLLSQEPSDEPTLCESCEYARTEAVEYGGTTASEERSVQPVPVMGVHLRDALRATVARVSAKVQTTERRVRLVSFRVRSTRPYTK